MLFAHSTPSLPFQDIPVRSHVSPQGTEKLISFRCCSAFPAPAARCVAFLLSPEHLFGAPELLLAWAVSLMDCQVSRVPKMPADAESLSMEQNWARESLLGTGGWTQPGRLKA